MLLELALDSSSTLDQVDWLPHASVNAQITLGIV